MILDQLIVNLAGVVRNEKMEDRTYMVVPMVMITEGVHHGSDGPMFYSEEELSKTPESWNHKPVVIYHPKVNGKPISACYPDVITEHKVGVVMNTWWDAENKKLRAEAWIDQDRLQKLDSRVFDSLSNNQLVEVSTGLFFDVDKTAGEWNGEQYDGVVTNFRPDHLAILPDEIGACSIEDGAGLLQVNNRNHQARQVIRQFVLNSRKLANNEMDHDSIREKLWFVLRQAYGDIYIESVFPERVVYNLGGLYYQIGYTENDENVILSGEPEKVNRVVEFRASTTSNSKESENESSNMKKEKIVNQIISANKGFTEDHRKNLMSMDETMLTPILQNVESQQKKTQEGEEEDGNGATKEGTDDGDAGKKTTTTEPPTQPASNKQVSLEEYISSAPVELREVLSNGVATLQRERKELIATIVANKSNTFTEKQLGSMSMDQLQGIAALAKTTTANTTKSDDDAMAYYGGAGFPAINTDENFEMPEPRGLPSSFVKS